MLVRWALRWSRLSTLNRGCRVVLRRGHCLSTIVDRLRSNCLHHRLSHHHRLLNHWLLHHDRLLHHLLDHWLLHHHRLLHHRLLHHRLLHHLAHSDLSLDWVVLNSLLISFNRDVFCELIILDLGDVLSLVLDSVVISDVPLSWDLDSLSHLLVLQH